MIVQTEIMTHTGYYPENCMWATRLEQANNKCSCKYITYNDEARTIADMHDFEDYFGGKEYG